MPELPDLEIFKQYADATALHKQIDLVRCRTDAPFEDISESTFRHRLDGARLTETRRHGKYLFVRTDRDFWLVLHFGMTGSLLSRRSDHDIGPDIGRLSDEELTEIVENGRGSVKSTLMNQSIVSGLGNIYSDEALFQAGIDPRKECASLSRRQAQAITAAVRRVIEAAVKAEADPRRMPESFLLPRRTEGAECPGCGGKLEKETVSGRSSYICPRCQTK